jgi:DNA-binding winged helix-turn-helix (wHTH) protein
LDRKYQASSGLPGSPPASPDRSGQPIRFAGFRLDADGSLFRGEALLHLPPRELAALRVLLAHAGQIVTPLQLKQALWGDVHVTADSVPRCLSSLRARLQPDDCIQTVYKRGYRLLAEVRPLDAPPARALPRLAIPPFDPGTGVPEHLGTSFAEETISRLSNAAKPLASILARDSVFNLALGGMTAQKIGEILNADLVLAGTLRAFPAHFRLRAEMIRVADGVQIWVEDLLVDRGRIAGSEAELVSRLNFRLNTGSGAGMASLARSAEPAAAGAESVLVTQESETHRAPIDWSTEELSISASAATEPERELSPVRREAFELFLRGRHEWQTLERHRMQDGLQHLTRATELDPSLIAAKVDLAHLCVTQCIYGFMSPTVAADLVQRTADSIPDLHLQAERMLPALAWVNYHFDRNLPAALWAFELSAHLPHDPWITRVRSMFVLSRHRFQEAIGLLRGAMEQDPYSPWLQNRLAWACHLDGRAAESLELVERTLRLFPDHEGTALYGSMILAYNGDRVRAVRLAEKLVQRQPYFDLAQAVEAYALACAGRTADARAILERLQWLSRERYVLKSFIPAVHVALGDLEAALAELRAANELRCPWFLQMLADPRLKPLHGHPEFEQLKSILAGMEATVQSNPPAQA